MSWRRWRWALLMGLGLGRAAGLVAAQTPAKVFRVGFLTATSIPFREEAFRQEMRRLGYTEGRNLTIEYRSAEGQFERLPALAAELVALKVDVIAAGLNQAPLAAKRAPATIPIVMIGVSDPVKSGLLASIARPGANVTGTASASADVVGKQRDLGRKSTRLTHRP